MSTISLDTWFREKKRVAEARVAALEQRHAALLAELEAARERLRIYEQVLADFERYGPDCPEPSELLAALREPEGSADRPLTPAPAPPSREESGRAQLPPPGPPGSLPDCMPELRELPVAQRFVALARRNNGHLFRRDLTRVWRGTFGTSAATADAVLYGLLRGDPHWQVLSRGHYYLAETDEGADDASQG